MTCQLLIKQSLLTQDITTFLFLFTEEGLKSGNNRTRLQSIRSLTEFLSEKHRYENLSPILEILLVYLHELPASHSNSRILLNNSIEHMKRILGPELYNNYLENYSPSIRRVFKENENRIPTVDTDLEDDEETPRASVQVSHLRDTSENSRFTQPGLFSLLQTYTTLFTFLLHTRVRTRTIFSYDSFKEKKIWYKSDRYEF